MRGTRWQRGAAALLWGGRNDPQQLEKLARSGSVCGHRCLPERAWSGGDIKARHPGITLNGRPVYERPPKMLTLEDRSPVGSMPLKGGVTFPLLVLFLKGLMSCGRK